jgi:hypothetical protein
MRHAGGSLSTDAANLDASRVWESQLHLAVKDGTLCFLFKNKVTHYHGRGFEMLAALTQHCRPDTVSNAFASLVSLFNDVQGESEPILEYRSRFEGLTQELSRCKVVLPHLLSVMLFLRALHIRYADIIKQFCTHFKSIETTSINSIVSDVAYQDGFKLVDSKKSKPGASPSPCVPATAAANTACQGQVWQSPFEWLTKYGLKEIKGCWMHAMAGTGICPICHCDVQPYHVPTKCPLLTELNRKLIVCQPARPSSAAAAPAGAKADPAGTPSPAPNPGGCAASTDTGFGSGSAGSVAAPSGLTAAVAPVSDEEGEYDTDEEFTWDGNETAFGDLNCNLTKSVGPYPSPSCCHARVSFSTNDAPSAFRSISLPTTITRLIDKLSLSPTAPLFNGCFAVADSGATDHMFPDKSSFISYKIVSGLQVCMGNNSYILVLGCGTANVALNGKCVLVWNSLHVPGLAAPLYSLRAHMHQPGCGFVASDTTGFLVYFPTFVLSVDTLVDCHLSYEPLGLCAPLETLHYAQPQCPPTYYPLELASASSTAIPSPTAPAFIEDNTSTVSMAVPPSLSPPLATEFPVDLGSVSTQLQALPEAIFKTSSTSAPPLRHHLPRTLPRQL